MAVNVLIYGTPTVKECLILVKHWLSILFLFLCICCDIYVVASKCSRHHFVYTKQQTIYFNILIYFLFTLFILVVNSKLFKLTFLENSSLVQLYTSASDCKGVENIHGSHFMKPIQLFRRILNDVSSITHTRRPISADFSRGNR